MREILFRGKRVRDGEWVFGSFVSPNMITAPMGEEIYGSDIVDPETVGEFTGLTDKNGNKIFEGDIVKYQPEYATVPIYSRVEYFADKYNYPAFDLAKHDYEANGLQCAHEEGVCEVIGNKWDNPELFEVEE